MNASQNILRRALALCLASAALWAPAAFAQGATAPSSLTLLDENDAAVNTPPLNAPVGQIVDYLYTVAVPQGTSASIAATVVLPAGLVFSSGSGLAVSGGPFTCGGAACTLPNPTTASATGATWTFNNVVDNSGNGADNLSFLVHAVVDNSAAAQAGTALTASGHVNTTIASATTVANVTADAVQVIEPSLTITSSIAPLASGDASDTYVVTVTLTNVNGDGTGSAANDLLISAPMPAGLEAVSGSYASTSCVDGTATLNATVASVGIPSLALASSCTFTFQVELLTAVNPSQTLLLAGTLTWTSEPGAVGQESIYSLTSTERTGDSSDPGGMLNDYTAPTSVSLTVLPLQLTLALQSAITAAVGTPVSYLPTITLPQGTTPNLVLVDTLPAGLTYADSGPLSPASMDLSKLTCNGAACVTPTPTVNGQVVTWSFGTVVNTDTNDSAPETLAFLISTQVANVAGNQAGTVLSDSVQLQGTALSAAAPQSVTVIEPQLTFAQTTSVSSAPNAPQAGDTLTTTVTITNASSATSATAYDVNVVYNLPVDAALLAAAPTANTCGTFSGGSPGTAQLSVTFDAVPVGSCHFTFTSTVTAAAQPSEALTETFSANWTSAAGAVAGERTGNTSDPGGLLNDYSKAGNAVLNVSVTTASPSVALTGTTSAAVGAPVASHVVITVPQGTTPSAQVTLTLPAGLVFQQGANFAASAGIACGGATCGLPTPAVSNGGRTIQVSFANIVDGNSSDATADTIAFDLISIVENVSASMATAAPYALSLAYTIGASTGTLPQSVQVIEPKLQLTVHSSPGIASGSDTVTTTVEIKNPTTATGSIAYEANVAFAFPAAKLAYVASSYAAGTCPTATVTSGAGALAFAFAPVALGVDCTFTFETKLTDQVTPTETETATGSATWTSQPGNITTSESTYQTDAVERTGSTANVGGALNDYSATGLNFAVTVPASSFAFTGPSTPDAAVGAPVVYRAAAVIPQGTTPELDVTVHFPTGLVFQQGMNLATTSMLSCNGAACTLPAPTVTSGGYTAKFVFTNVVNDNLIDSGDDMIAFDVVGIVENQSQAQAGAVYASPPDALFVVGTTMQTITAEAFTVIEPQIHVTNTGTPTTAAGNDIITVSVNVANPSSAFGATAYNVTAGFTLPSGFLAPVQGSYAQGTCPLATQTLTAALAQFEFAALPMSTNCNFSFQVRLAAAVTQQSSYASVGTVTWTSQPGATAIAESTYQADSTERTGSISDPGGALNDYLQAGFGFSVTTPASTFQYTGPVAANSAAAVGAPVVFHVLANLPRGTTPELDVAVTLPSGLAFQKSANLVASAGVNCSGIVCALPPPTVAAGSVPGSSVVSWAVPNIVDFNSPGTSGESLQWDVVAIVENDATSVAGATYSSKAHFAVGTADQATFTSGAVTVIEPALTFSNSSTPALAAANDKVTVTVKMVNPSRGTNTDAFDVLVSYALPSGKLTAVQGSFAQGNCPAGTAVLSGAQASFDFASVPVGTSCSFSFMAQLTQAVGPLETETATGVATWTSLAGDVTQSESLYATDAVERTGSIADPGGALNTYVQSNLGFDVSTTGSLFSFTGPSPLATAVGGIATYHLAAVIPQGTTPALTATVTLPHGLVFQKGQNLTATSGITCSGAPCTLPAPSVSADGYTAQWTLINLVNANATDTMTDSIGFDVLAVVENTATSIAGATYTANAVVAVGANSAALPALALTVLEPHVTFASLATPQTVSANDVSTILVTLANPTIPNGTDAYNVTATYTLATGKQTAVSGSYTPGNCPVAAATSLAGNTASFTFARLPLGTTCQFAWQVRLTTTVLQAEQETATAVGTWTSGPDAVSPTLGPPQYSLYATDSTERTGMTTLGNGTAAPGGALNNYLQTNFGFTLTVPASDFIFAGPSVPSASVGGTVLFHAGASIPQATLNRLTLVVLLPPGLVFQNGINVAVSNGISCGGLPCTLPTPLVTDAGHTVEYDFTNIVDSNDHDETDSIEWDVATIVENNADAQSGAQEVSSAVFSSDLTTKSFTAPALIVDEPTPSFAIVGTSPDTQPAQSFAVTVSVKNPLVANNATAYNATLTFALPANALEAVAGSYTAGTCPAATPALAGSSASFVFAALPPGTDCTFSFSLEVDPSAAQDANEVANGSATWTSLPGTTNNSQSIYAGDATARTGDATDPGGALNDYRQSGFNIAVHVPSAYFQSGIGASGGGCSGTAPSDLAWLGLVFAGLVAWRKRYGLSSMAKSA